MFVCFVLAIALAGLLAGWLAGCVIPIVSFAGLTIPVIPEDEALSGTKWNNGFERLRAVCAMQAQHHCGRRRGGGLVEFEV